MLRTALAAALAVLTVAATVAPAEAHRRHHRHHGHHGGGITFGFNYGPAFHAPRPYYYAPRRRYLRRVVPAYGYQPAYSRPAAPWQTPPGATYQPAPVQAQPYLQAPTQTYAPAPVTTYSPAPVTTYAPAPTGNATYENIGAYQDPTSVQTSPAPVYAPAPVTTYSADTIQVVPADQVTSGPTYATSETVAPYQPTTAGEPVYVAPYQPGQTY